MKINRPPAPEYCRHCIEAIGRGAPSAAAWAARFLTRTQKSRHLAGSGSLLPRNFDEPRRFHGGGAAGALPIAP
ncbi:hypothetical protein P5495_022130 [Bacillus velezensis]|uniref:hypothetical protein n=1 Tax=Bacillus velezensis TaxID=492670 RepID=UPI0037ECDEA8|nr:hypothetical protein [Bacillus velezensis]MDH3104042.1 hypothetical protein [Bacillus velezensis]MDH3138971.1 hypothetical protein [Bacillus velezensis]